ncbi:MAG: ATPase [Opitutae bacterium]|nr:ATPase [Opitutae bacterium]|tara:strand:- start:2278 stop:3966 length:1689 start_codon:yes stop_codon:yes gene_type:complete
MAFTGILEACGIGLILPLISLLSVEDIKDANPFVAQFHAILGFPKKTDFMVILFALVILLFVFKNALLILYFWCQTKFVVGINKRISYELYQGYLRQPYSYHTNKNTSEIIRNSTIEVSQFSYSVLMQFYALIAEILVVTIIFSFLFYLQPLGTIIISGILLFCVSCFYFAIKNKLTSWGKSRQLHDGYRVLHLQQGFGAIKEVKIFGCESFFEKAYGDSNTQVANEWTKQIFFSQVPRFGVELVAVTGLISFAITLILLGYESLAIISSIGLFAAAAFRLIPSSNRILASIQAIRFGLPTLDLISTEMVSLSKKSFDDESASSLINSLENKISVKNLAFKHDQSEKNIISGLNFELSKGESIGIVGSSGVGKSTLVNLLLSLNEPLAGEVMVDGIDIKSDIQGWRNLIGYVPQTVYISDSSLRENIAFGLPKDLIDDSHVWAVLQSARLDDFVRSLDGGLDTVMGERGARISGGQCQRIGIARALYRNPTVLIFDEATSALDNKTETEFMETIRAFRGDKTMIVVAHRLSTLKYCDKVLQMYPNCEYKLSSKVDSLEASIN